MNTISRALNYKDIFDYNLQFFTDTEERKRLTDVINFNKMDINKLLVDDRDTVIDFNINEVRKNLKKLNSRYCIKENSTIGNLYSFGINIDYVKNTDMILSVPMGNYIDKPLAQLSMNYYTRNRRMKLKFEQLIVALRSNKISFEYEVTNKGRNIIDFRVLRPQDNERFWYTVKLWSKR